MVNHIRKHYDFKCFLAKLFVEINTNFKVLYNQHQQLDQNAMRKPILEKISEVVSEKKRLEILLTTLTADY